MKIYIVYILYPNVPFQSDTVLHTGNDNAVLFFIIVLTCKHHGVMLIFTILAIF